jgi:hypothetical protein
MKADEEILDKLRKIYKVLGRGTVEEQSNIQKKFDELCKKYDLDPDDFKEEKPEPHLFYYTEGQALFMAQIISSVVGDIPIMQYPNFPNAWGCTCTNAEFFEIRACFDFHWEKYEKEREIFYIAYIQKNELHTKNSSGPGIESRIANFNKDKLKVYQQTIPKNNHNNQLKQGF